jgi:triosephosphate isomerase
VILGHSERRQYFREDNTLLASKVSRALEHGLTPIYCCGESLEVRKDGNHEELVTQQIEEGLFHLPAQSWENLVIAYEPVWAIGTGEVATPKQAQEMHAYIRQLIDKKYSADLAQGISILYGGSMKPANAEELLSQPDVDGGLIGGASLKANEFTAIYQSI